MSELFRSSPTRPTDRRPRVVGGVKLETTTATPSNTAIYPEVGRTDGGRPSWRMVNNDADEVLRAVAYAHSFFTNIKPGIIIRKGGSDFETESIIAIDGASIVFR